MDFENVLIDYINNLKNPVNRRGTNAFDRVCSQCRTKKTAQWRHGHKVGFSDAKRVLCNACGISFKKYGSCSKCFTVLDMVTVVSHTC